MFWVICKQLGEPIRQNKQGMKLIDVKCTNASRLDPDSRGVFYRNNLNMHTDMGSILGMACIQAACSGGETKLSSVERIHCEIEKSRPDLLKVLYEPFYTDRRNEHLDKDLPYSHNSIFKIEEGTLLCQYVRYFIDDAQIKYPEIPRLTSQQIEALNLLDTVANIEEALLVFKLNAGDIIFLNNNKVLHGRAAYENNLLDENLDRHLFRIWLETPLIKSIPSIYGYF